jgi:hypothetical protein
LLKTDDPGDVRRRVGAFRPRLRPVAPRRDASAVFLIQLGQAITECFDVLVHGGSEPPSADFLTQAFEALLFDLLQPLALAPVLLGPAPLLSGAGALLVATDVVLGPALQLTEE